MRHAAPVALDALEPLLVRLRSVEGLTERKRGVFYRGSKAFLHFHEDRAGFFADVRLGPAWERVDVTSTAQRNAFAKRVKAEF